VQTEVVHRVSENGLLNEEDVALGFLNLLNHVEQICSLLLEDLVHLPVVVDDNLVLHVWFRWAQLELNETYPCLLLQCGATSALDYWLVENQSVDHLAVFNGTTRLLDHPDVLQVYVVCGLGVDDLEY
jgi:hypothetical protein